METIDLASEDDEDSGDARGLCIKCGQVSKPHVCPHAAKIMKRMSRSECGMSSSKCQKTSAGSSAAKNDMYKNLFGDDSDDDDTPAPKLPEMPKAAAAALSQGAPAFNILNTLLQEHSTLQTECDSNKATIEKQKKDIAAVKKRETAANSAVKQATSQLAQLQQEIAKRDQTIADQQKQLQGPAPFVPPKPKGKGKAAVAAAAAAAASALGLSPGKDAYSALLTDAGKAYTDKADALKKKAPPPPPPVPPAPVAPAPLPNRVQILQKNTNPQYHTEREVSFMTTAQVQAAGLPSSTTAGWFFDNSTPPTPWQPSWVPISDTTIIGNLETLGTATKSSTGDTTAFTPTVGSTVSYPFGQHNYTVTVVNAPGPQAPAPPPPPPPPPPAPWQDDMLFTGSFFKMDKKYIDRMLQQYHFDEPDVVIPKSTEIAAIAEQWSSYAQGFKYDPNKCEMWVKPNWMHMWLRAAKERGYNEARILMHGMRSQNYHLLAKDLSGFDFNFSQQGAKRWGFYAACSDHIASDYNAQSGGPLPDGTGVIGLLLIKKGAGAGAYEHYHLGSHRGGPQSYSINDAYAVRDQMLWLPLGLAYAKP